MIRAGDWTCTQVRVLVFPGAGYRAILCLPWASCVSRQLAKRAVGDSESIHAIIRLNDRRQRFQPRTLCWESEDGLQGKTETW